MDRVGTIAPCPETVKVENELIEALRRTCEQLIRIAPDQDTLVRLELAELLIKTGGTIAQIGRN